MVPRHPRRSVLGVVGAVALLAVAACSSPAAARADGGGRAVWREVFRDEFDTADGFASRWQVYDGQPRGDPAGCWHPSHVVVAQGRLTLQGYRDGRFCGGGRFVTGGVSTTPGAVQTYGRYRVRVRLDRGNGVNYALLLWRRDDHPLPEVDFAEDVGGARTATTATFHDAAGHRTQRSVVGDLTRWHTLGVDWSPGRLVFTQDGVAFGTIQHDQVPSVPMVLAIQTQAWPCLAWTTCVDATTPARVDLQVDWVTIDAPA